MLGCSMPPRPELLKLLREKYFPHVSQAKIMADTRAFLDYLAAQPDVKPGGVGPRATAWAGPCRSRLQARTPSASPRGLVSRRTLGHQRPESPHLLAPKMKARVYVAGAIEDQSFPDDMKARLKDALSQAGVEHEVETAVCGCCRREVAIR
jgi:carboxymethylenebutenolidase